MSEEIPNIFVTEVQWALEHQRIMGIREAVFIQEQQVPEEEELDDHDALPATRHFLLTAGDRAIGYARLQLNGQIGRMAIVRDARKSGYGARLLAEVMRAALQELRDDIFLHAQEHAIPFYQKMGFETDGDVFYEAGIPHKMMRLALSRETLEKIYSDNVYRLNNAAGFVFHMAQMARCASRKIAIYCNELEPTVWAQELLVDAISYFARNKINSTVKILIADSRGLQSGSHPLVRLCQRLSSSIEIRVLNEDAEAPKHAFFTADSRQLVLFNDETTYQGFANYIAPAESQHELDTFDRLWDYGSAQDPNLAQIVL